jgi:hypothetical protein
MDIQTAVMTRSSFRAAPRKGHLERVKRIVGYLTKMRHGATRVHTHETDFSSFGTPVHDWMSTVNGDCVEDVPTDAPPPMGKFVITVSYVDANLMHDMISGKSVSGCIHFLNQTPIDGYSKKQATVETATYRSEFVAARTCMEQIIEIRTLQLSKARHCPRPSCTNGTRYSHSIEFRKRLPQGSFTSFISMDRSTQLTYSASTEVTHKCGRTTLVLAG